MPNYEFECKKCQKKYAQLTKWDATEEYPDVECPKCNSKEKTKLVSLCGAIMFSNPVGTDKMLSHDWAFHWKHEKAQDERRAAEAAQGSAPYNPIDDVSGGQFFGEVE